MFEDQSEDASEIRSTLGTVVFLLLNVVLIRVIPIKSVASRLAVNVHLPLPPVRKLKPENIMELMRMAESAAVNPFTGNRYFLPILIEKSNAEFAVQHYCSLLRSGIQNESIIFCSFDDGGCEIISAHGARCIQIIPETPFKRYEEKFKMKIYLLYLQNWWGLEAYAIDSDIIFFDDFRKAFHNGVDIEMSTDDDLEVTTHDAEKVTALENSGFARFLPTENARNVLMQVFRNGEAWEDHRDQLTHTDTYRKLRDGKRVGMFDIEYWNYSGIQATFRYVEPFKVSNGGLAFCRGKQRLWKYMDETARTSMKMPVGIHFNYHYRGKLDTYKWLKLDMCHHLTNDDIAIFRAQLDKITCDVTAWEKINGFINTSVSDALTRENQTSLSKSSAVK